MFSSFRRARERAALQKTAAQQPAPAPKPVHVDTPRIVEPAAKADKPSKH